MLEQLEQLSFFENCQEQYNSEIAEKHRLNPLQFEQALATKYKYRKLPKDISDSVRNAYTANIPIFLDLNGTQSCLHSSANTLICTEYKRIVIGDYGAFLEFDHSMSNSKDFTVKNGQEYRINNPRYSNNVKYHWYTVCDNSDVKIYYQIKGVCYADYVPSLYYVSVHEVFPKK